MKKESRLNKIKRKCIAILKDDMSMTKISLITLVSMIPIVLILIILINYSGSTTNALANKIIRFHVVANSDSTQDQLLKQQVRDEIIAYMEPLLEDSTSIEDTRYIIKESLPLIKEVVEEIVVKWDKDYDIYVTLDEANFPTKSYGDVVLPAGKYEACRVVIGEGKGENWWCVMFPPLCYLDASSGVVPLEGKEQLEEQLNAEQYNLITQKDKPYQIRFKLIDKVNSFLNPSNYKKTN